MSSRLFLFLVHVLATTAASVVALTHHSRFAVIEEARRITCIIRQKREVNIEGERQKIEKTEESRSETGQPNGRIRVNCEDFAAELSRSGQTSDVWIIRGISP